MARQDSVRVPGVPLQDGTMGAPTMEAQVQGALLGGEPLPQNFQINEGPSQDAYETNGCNWGMAPEYGPVPEATDPFAGRQRTNPTPGR